MVSRKQRPGGRAAVKPTVDEFIASRERMNRASTEFLKIDLETALTFLRIARQTTDGVRKRRNLSSARRAYETVLKLTKKIDLALEDRRIVVGGLERLRSELEHMGEVF